MAMWCMYSACMVKVGHYIYTRIKIVTTLCTFLNDVTSHATLTKRDGYKYKHTCIHNIIIIQPQTERLLRD